MAIHLAAGRDVALLCEGDPLFFGSFMHLYVRLRGRFPSEVIPGISGMSGCWSAAGLPMSWGDDILTVLPGTLPFEALRDRLDRTDAAVIMKIGTHFEKVRAAVEAAGLMEDAIYVERGTMAGEVVTPLRDKADRTAPTSRSCCCRDTAVDPEAHLRSDRRADASRKAEPAATCPCAGRRAMGAAGAGACGAGNDIMSVATATMGGKTPLNRSQIIGFWSAWAGWMLDGMDSFIYALVLKPALTELLPKSGIAATKANIGTYGSILFACSSSAGASPSSGVRSPTASAG